MSVKIISTEHVGYQPVTIELTFDTMEQLKAFVKIYGNPMAVSKCINGASEQAIEETIDDGTWCSLRDIVENYET